MPRLLVIADDFTGALDTAVQFSRQDIASFMSTDISIDMAAVPSEVLAIDAETRILPPHEAYNVVFSLCQRAKTAGISMVYKKTDSTLRGNIGAELEAAVKALGLPLAFAPAYPQNGRITIDSVQYADGLPVAETGLKDDPINPVLSSYIPDIIALTSPVGVITDGRLEAGHITLFDASSRAGLEDLFGILLSQNALGLTAGSAGLAGAIAAADFFRRSPQKIVRRGGGILAVCGSVNPISTAQCSAAREAGLNVECLSGRELFEGDTAKILPRLAERLKSGFLLLHTDGDRFLPPGAPAKIAEALGDIAARLITQGVGYLLLFGGNTADNVMKKAGISGFSPRTEIAPGVVWSETERLSIITKAGGFGGPDVISEILDYIRQDR